MAPIDISPRSGCSHGHSAVPATGAGCSASPVAPGASELCASAAVATSEAMPAAASRRTV